MISSINYRNMKKKTDFEIVDIRQFFATRAHLMLGKDFRLNFWAIIFITEGTGTHSIDFVDHFYKPGSVIFIQKNQVHHFVPNKEAGGYIIHINEPFFYRIKGFNGDIFLEFVDKSFGTSVLNLDLSAGSTNRSLLDLILQEYKKDENFNIELIASLFQGLILSMQSENPEGDLLFSSKEYENFKVYRQLVEQNYTKIRSVEEYADKMGLSKKTINQAVRRVADMSAKQYIINRIILEIKRYLSQGELLNYEIADALGFDEAANMTNFFSRYVGMSPKDFRKTGSH